MPTIPTLRTTASPFEPTICDIPLLRALPYAVLRWIVDVNCQLERTMVQGRSAVIPLAWDAYTGFRLVHIRVLEYHFLCDPRRKAEEWQKVCAHLSSAQRRVVVVVNPRGLA